MPAGCSRLPPRGHRGPFRFVLKQNPLRRRGSRRREVVRKPAGKQFVKNRAKRINVGLDSDPVAADLLRRGVSGRHQAQPGARLFRRAVKALQLFGDPEVEQANGPIRLDEDVGGLQITMDDRVLMGVLHGLAHGAKER